MLQGMIKLDLERYSSSQKALVILGAVLLVLALLKGPKPAPEYDERCYVEHCQQECGRMGYRFERFEYRNEVSCTCKTNVTEQPVRLYGFSGSVCPAVKRDQRCEKDYCDDACVDGKGFLPGHSYIVIEGNQYKCVCEDRDVGWYEVPYSLDVKSCVN